MRSACRIVASMTRLAPTVLVAALALLAAAACNSEVLHASDDDAAGGGDVAGGDGVEDGEDGDGVSTSAGGPAQASATSGSSSVVQGAGGGAQGAGGGGGAEEAGVGGAGGGAPVSEVCALTRSIALSDVVLEDGPWAPGEAATVSATLTSPVDHFAYPGLRVTVETPGVTPPTQENVLFGLLAGEPTVLPLFLEAEPSVPPGTVVTLHLEVFSLNEPCEGTAEATVEVVVDGR